MFSTLSLQIFAETPGEPRFPFQQKIASYSGTQASPFIQKTWGVPGQSQGNAIAICPQGDSYVLGTTFNGTGSSHVPLLKYAANGTLLWQRIWNNTNLDSGNGLSVDASCNAYLGGITELNGFAGSFLLKVNSTGGLVWQRVWGGDGTGGAVAFDPLGSDVYVIGGIEHYNGRLFYRNLGLLKFDLSGTLLWNRTWSDALNDTVGSAIAVDSNTGYVYIAGNSVDYYRQNAFLLKIDSTGSLVWQQIWGRPYARGIFFRNIANGIAIDSLGDPLVTGWSGTRYATAVELTKFDSSGSLKWEQTIGGSRSNLNDQGNSITTDKSNDIYVAGTTQSFGVGYQSPFLLKFDSSGNPMSQMVWGTVNLNGANGVVVDLSGNVAITGDVANAPPYTVKSQAPSPNAGTPIVDKYNFTDTNQNFVVANSTGTLSASQGSESFEGSLDLSYFRFDQVIPVATVTFQTYPADGGSIHFLDFAQNFSNGATANFTYGNLTVVAYPANSIPGEVLSRWSASGGIGVADNHSNETLVSIIGSGLLQAKFSAPPQTITFQTNQIGGVIIFNGTSYRSGESGNATYGGNVTAIAIPPAGFRFNSWVWAGDIRVSNVYAIASEVIVTVDGPGILGAAFSPVPATTPANTGGPLIILLLLPAFLAVGVGIVIVRRRKARLDGKTAVDDGRKTVRWGLIRWSAVR